MKSPLWLQLAIAFLGPALPVFAAMYRTDMADACIQAIIAGLGGWVAIGANKGIKATNKARELE